MSSGTHFNFFDVLHIILFQCNVLTKIIFHSVRTLDRPRTIFDLSRTQRYSAVPIRWHDVDTQRSMINRRSTTCTPVSYRHTFVREFTFDRGRARLGKKGRIKTSSSGAFRVSTGGQIADRAAVLCDGLCRRWQSARSFYGIARYHSSPRKPAAISYPR